jgi:hypothetical protein
MNELPNVCDKFQLHLLVMSEDLSFHFKYMDVVRGIAESRLANERGELERDR